MIVNTSIIRPGSMVKIGYSHAWHRVTAVSQHHSLVELAHKEMPIQMASLADATNHIRSVITDEELNVLQVIEEQTATSEIELIEEKVFGACYAPYTMFRSYLAKDGEVVLVSINCMADTLNSVKTYVFGSVKDYREWCHKIISNNDEGPYLMPGDALATRAAVSLGWIKQPVL